jgi:hypothetical protein
MEAFVKELKKKLTAEVKLLFLPKISQERFYSLIHRNVINTATIHRLPIRKMEILEFADHEYLIKINHNIEVQFIAEIPVDEEKEVSNG